MNGGTQRPADRPARTFKPSEVLELRRLFDLLSDTAASASDVLREAGTAPRGLPIERLDGTDAGLQDIMNRIKAILDAVR